MMGLTPRVAREMLLRHIRDAPIEVIRREVTHFLDPEEKKNIPLLLPKTFVPDEELKFPLFFLLGPIQGGDEWQAEAYVELYNKLLHKGGTVVSPCRYPKGHPILRMKKEGQESYFTRQLIWERYYLERASRRGCIIGWLPAESLTTPRKDGQPYGRDSYGEVGEWRGRLISERRLHFVLGIEPGFPGGEIIKANFHFALGKRYPVYSTLEEVVDAALKKAGVR